MNYAIILAGGTGQRMRQTGMPKQFLDVYGKPIIVYTLEVFQKNASIDEIVIPCNKKWREYLEQLVDKYQLTKVRHIVAGGVDRTESVLAGLNVIQPLLQDDDIVVIHDGVRPLVQQETIDMNIEAVRKYGNAMTVRPTIETVVVTETETACWGDFKKRAITYSLTSPQSFRAKELIQSFVQAQEEDNEDTMPLLDASMLYARLGREIHLVIESGNNLKITTPEDYYYLKAYLELQESKHILGM